MFFFVVFFFKKRLWQDSSVGCSPLQLDVLRAQGVSAALVTLTLGLSEEARGSWKALFPRLFVPRPPSSR